MSERRACRVVAVDRSSVRYRHRRCDDNRLRERLKALAEERRRFGYRRLWVLLRREGHTVNRKRIYRLYKEERLMVRRRGGRKRAIGVRSPMPLPLKPNQRWSLDFVHDQITDGRRLRNRAVVDDTRASVWLWWPTHRSRASASPASSTRLLLCVAGPAVSSRTMAPN